jgi:hypothetical protein
MQKPFQREIAKAKARFILSNVKIEKSSTMLDISGNAVARPPQKDFSD